MEIALPVWVDLVLKGGALTVLAAAVWAFMTSKLYSKGAVEDIRADADKRLGDANKRVEDAKEERDRAIQDRAQLLNLMIGFKFTAQEALDHLPGPTHRGPK